MLLGGLLWEGNKREKSRFGLNMGLSGKRESFQWVRGKLLQVRL